MTKEKSKPASFRSIRGDVFVGTVISAKAPKTVTVVRVITHWVGKYERYKKVKSKLKAHNPDEIGAKEGDTVRIEFSSTDGFHDWVVDEFAAATDRVRDTDGSTVLSVLILMTGMWCCDFAIW